MSVTVVVGAQWGDEGKGKIVDILSSEADIVARYQGGANAGHTINLKGEEYILHLVPSGILHPNTRCVIGNGVVVELDALIKELDFLKGKGISVDDRLSISDRAHIIFPHHKILDQLGEQKSTKQRIGTTGRGIGPAYADKFNRRGIRMVDMLKENDFSVKLREIIVDASDFLKRNFQQSLENKDQIFSNIIEMRKRIIPFIKDTSLILHQGVKNGEKVLFEGAQGTLLDIDHGTYPFVTCSNPVSGGACTGTGIGPTQIDHVVGVIKAYTTRVGEGPFPTELTGKSGDSFRETGREYGATTGRPRRCGWFDLVIARYATRINGLTSLAITKLDVLDELPEINVCVNYRCHQENLGEFPADLKILESCEPVYKTFPGWQTNTKNMTDYHQLPSNAQKYIEYIENETGVPVSIISVGPMRRQTIFR
jgi:adenylosuccinate synthase